MLFVLTLLFATATTPFESTIDKAFAGFQNNDWIAAAAALDQAYSEDPALFAANNFHYLRGRIAERQEEWQRARDEYKQIARDNPLFVPALWHAARTSAKLHEEDAAIDFLSMLPRNFPSELKIQIASEVGKDAALKIYQDLSTREARYQRALALRDNTALWSLIRESKDDDVALVSARTLVPLTTTPADQMELAEVFGNHRQFDEALALDRRLETDPMYAPDARFRIARIHFQRENYQLALDDFLALAKDFPNSDWEKEAIYQAASCYWRLADYRNSEKTYLGYIQKYGTTGMREAATRNLVDVYRVLGENQKAITTLDRALATKLSAATRQVFLFTKAKVLYTEKKYSAALLIFQQLARTKLRSAPGSATAEEVQYFQALCYSKLGNKSMATAIWKKLASDAFSYYGQRSAEKLGQSTVRAPALSCSADRNSVLSSIETDLVNQRHPLRNEPDSAGNTVSELLFLRLWDEAALWMDWTGQRPAQRTAAQIAYLGGQYDRSISLADLLPRTAANLPLLYPSGYWKLICDAAAGQQTDPLWLQAIIWQESKYNPNSRSGASARGLMQFIPETARDVAASIGMAAASLDRLYDPAVSIQLGAAYWSTLMQKLKSPEMALAAYNGGPDNVARWIAKSPDPELFVSDIGFVETKKYVMLVFAARAAYASLVN